MPSHYPPMYDTSPMTNEELVDDPNKPGPDTPHLEQLAVYLHPKELPDGVMVRRWYVVHDGTGKLILGRGYGFRGDDALARARQWIADWFGHMTLVPRFDQDDPTVVETYM